MSYYLYDSNGYVGDLASNSGLKALRKFVLPNGGKCLKEFFDNGSLRN